MLAPHQPVPSPERRQIDQFDDVAFLDRRRFATARTRRTRPGRLDVHEQRAVALVDAPSTRTAGGPTSSSHMRVGSVITGALHLKASRTLGFAEPLCHARDPLRSYTPLISEEPDIFRVDGSFQLLALRVAVCHCLEECGLSRDLCRS